MEILLVEDALSFAKITMGSLRLGSIEHRLTWLTDGEETLDFLYRRGRFSKAPRPDLILLDLGLPKMDGREVLANIKTDEDFQTIAVVVMTGSESYEDRIESERLNVDAYLTKPVDLDKELKSYWQEDMIVPGGN
jgi:CheY-like chemotaxis protein